MAISIDYTTLTITVPKADSTLVSAGPPEIRDYDVFEKLWKELIVLQANEEGIPFEDGQRHFTAVTVGGVNLAHVVEIINGYTVTFEDGAYELNTKGANHNVLDVANLNTVGLRSSNSGGLLAANIERATVNLQFMIETLRAEHRAFGSVFYWDPVNGLDSNSGASPATAFLTFAAAQAAVTANKSDVIFILNDSAAALTITERITITKNDLNLRGPGPSVVFQPTDDAAPTITVSADNVGLSGFKVATTGATPQHAISATCDLLSVRDLWVVTCTDDGIHVVGGSDHIIENCTIELCAGDGAHLIDTVNAKIFANRIQRNTGFGVNLEEVTTARETWIGRNVFHHNGPGSINVGAGVFMTIITKDNSFFPAPGTPGGDDIVDAGTATHNEYNDFTQKVFDLWQLQGLDIPNPMTVTPTSRTVDGIAQTISGDGETTTTVTRTS